jgi:outer membrane protein TolC
MRQMKWLSKFFACAFLLAIPVAAAGQQPSPVPVVTLDEAVDLALRVSPAMVQRQGAVQTAESAERTTGWGAYLPFVQLSSGASRASNDRFDSNTNTVVSGSSDSYNARVSTGFDLFTGFRRGAAHEQARANTNAAEASLVASRFQTALTAKQAFFNVLRADETIRSAQATLDRALQGLRAAEQRLTVGSATRSDSLRAQLEVMQARQSLLAAQNRKQAFSYTLGAVIGYDGAVNADPATATEPTPLALAEAELLALAITGSPSVEAALASHDANESAISVARASYFPALSVSGGYTWNNTDFTLSGGRTSWTTGLSLSYPLFNRFTREDNYERARVNARTTQYALDDARRQTRAEVRTAIDGLWFAEQQITIAREAAAVAAEDLRVQQTRYELGASTILDRITSQASLANAELNLIDARYDYLIARARLESLVGREL